MAFRVAPFLVVLSKSLAVWVWMLSVALWPFSAQGQGSETESDPAVVTTSCTVTLIDRANGENGPETRLRTRIPVKSEKGDYLKSQQEIYQATAADALSGLNLNLRASYTSVLAKAGTPGRLSLVFDLKAEDSACDGQVNMIQNKYSPQVRFEPLEKVFADSCKPWSAVQISCNGSSLSLVFD